MILKCLQCFSHFLIDSNDLSPEGRRVKCGKCGHVWFVEPKPLISSKKEEITSLHPENTPIVSGSNLPVLVRASDVNKANSLWLLVVLLTILIGFLLWIGKESIIRIWPVSNDFYSILYSILGY